MGFYNYNDNAQAQPVSLDLNAVMRQVYAWMTLGLLATAGTAFWLASSGAAIKIFSSTPIMLITIVGYLILGFTLQPIVTRSQPVVGIIAYLALTILMGIMLSSIFLTYRLGTIGFAFLATAGAF